MSDPFVKRLELNCEPPHAFAVLTERVDLWWPRDRRSSPAARMTLDAKVGGKLRDDNVLVAEVIAIETPSRLMMAWHDAGANAPTGVDLRIEPLAGGALLVVTHADPQSVFGTAWPIKRQQLAGLWSAVLGNFAGLCAMTFRPGV